MQSHAADILLAVITFVSAFNLFLLSFVKLYYTVGNTFAPLIFPNSSPFGELLLKPTDMGLRRGSRAMRKRSPYDLYNETINIRVLWYLLERILLPFTYLGSMGLIPSFLDCSQQVKLISAMQPTL